MTETEKQIAILQAYFVHESGKRTPLEEIGRLLGRSHETIRNWITGTTTPTFDDLRTLLAEHQDAGNEVAAEVINNLLAARYPDLYQPQGDIGTRVLIASPMVAHADAVPEARPTVS